MFNNPFGPRARRYKRILSEFELINFKLNHIMATLAEVNTSLDALDAEVTAIKAAGTGAATTADLDAVKARIDAATTALQA
jgi:hypothetical protein